MVRVHRRHPQPQVVPSGTKSNWKPRNRHQISSARPPPNCAGLAARQATDWRPPRRVIPSARPEIAVGVVAARRSPHDRRRAVANSDWNFGIASRSIPDDVFRQHPVLWPKASIRQMASVAKTHNKSKNRPAEYIPGQDDQHSGTATERVGELAFRAGSWRSMPSAIAATARGHPAGVNQSRWLGRQCPRPLRRGVKAAEVGQPAPKAAEKSSIVSWGTKIRKADLAKKKTVCIFA